MRCAAILFLTIILAHSAFALTGSGTAEEPYLIQSLADFDEFAGNSAYWDDHIRLEVDIDLAGRTYTTAVIAPDTSSSSAFQGTAFTGSFDGSGRKIVNLTIDTAGAGNDHMGLFGLIKGSTAEVMDLGVENAVITGGNSSSYLGVLCGYYYSGTICRCYSSGSITGGTDLGGLCGYSVFGTISDCCSSSQISGGNSSRNLGGLCGRCYAGTIGNCYSSGSVTGGADSYSFGGLCGINSYGTISKCYSSGSVTGGADSYSLGGLCGVNSYGTVSDCYFYLFAGPDNHLGAALEAGQMTQQHSYAGFDFAGDPNDGTEAHWSMTPGRCPRLSWQTDNGPLPPDYVPDTTLPGSGLGGDPFRIASEAQFSEFVTNDTLDRGYYVLECDIDLSGQSFTTAVTSRYFGGHLDGGSHMITNITIDTGGAGTSYLGVFGRMTGSIHNLGIENISISGGADSHHLGGLCGYNYSGTICNCYATGEISGGNDSDYLGGLCGYNDSGEISDCYSSGSVTGGNDSGGLGGLCGVNGGMITDCYAVGSVSGGVSSYYLGGLCGYNYYGTIGNCYTNGVLSGGYNSSYLGGLCGSNYSGTISNCYFYLFVGPDNNQGTDLEAGQMTEPFNFIGFDFAGDPNDGTEAHWSITQGRCPRLSWQTDAGPMPPDYVPEANLPGSGYAGDPFRITSEAQFSEFITNDTLDRGYYLLECDVDLSGQSFTTAVISRYFGGHLDGGGHRIANITIDTGSANTNYLGLFGRITGSVRDLGIENISITGGKYSQYLGGLCGWNWYGTISDCYARGTVIGGVDSYYLGGLCGMNYYSTISNCYSGGSVTGGTGSNSYYLGGLCGRNKYGTINYCYSDGSVSGDDSLGGLCGFNEYGTISNCYATGQVTGGDYSWYLGGLCGMNYYGTISVCYAMGEVAGNGAYHLGGLCGENRFGIISHCYASGAVSGYSAEGGFCGYQDGESALMEACFWDIETSGTTKGFSLDSSYPGVVTNVLGRTTAQMQTQSTFVDAGWDFVLETANGRMDIWYMPPSDYPKLWWQHLPVADVDMSGVVDIPDLYKLCEEWLLVDGVIPNYRLKCDINEDGSVDLVDFAGLASCWLGN